MTNNKKRRALGRGLSNLIPTGNNDNVVKSDDIVEINKNEISPNPYQPRLDFDEKEISDLASSIKTQGLLQPVVVRKNVEGYHIISGERRFRAMQSLGFDTIPCIVKENVTDREMLEMALVENVQRANLNEIETALAYQRLLSECGLSHDELSKSVGKSRSSVTNTLRLLKLPEDVQMMVRKGKISMGHARAIISINTPEKQKEIANLIVEEKLSVRDVEKFANGTYVKKQKKQSNNSSRKQFYDPDFIKQEEKLQYHFGTSAKIVTTDGVKGKIEISFYSSDDLNRILDIINLKN